MALYALDDIEDAVDATKRFLLPFDRVRWFRLAVVMLFVAGAGVSQFPTFTGDFGATPEDPGAAPGEPSADPGALTPELTPELLVLIAGLFLFFLALGLLWAILGATMEFVFIDSLRQEEVRLRRYVKRHWRRGVRLFVFRTVVGLLSVAAFGAVALGVVAGLGGWPPTGWSTATAFSVVLFLLPIGALFAIVVGNLLGFTTMFVVPVMLAEDRGVLSAWRRFWPTMTGQWKQYLGYALIGFLLDIGVGIAAGFIGLLAAIAVAIPFAIVGIPLVLLLGLQSAGALVLLVLVVLYAVVMLILSLLIQVPFQTFLRYFALLVLGDTNDEFDVIPEARRAVRADGGDDAAGAATDDGDGGDRFSGGRSDRGTGFDDPGRDDWDGGRDVDWDIERDESGDRAGWPGGDDADERDAPGSGPEERDGSGGDPDDRNA